MPALFYPVLRFLSSSRDMQHEHTYLDHQNHTLLCGGIPYAQKVRQSMRHIPFYGFKKALAVSEEKS